MRFFYRLRFIIFLVMLGSLFSTSVQITQADGLEDIGYPFGPCQTWYVFQGYNGFTHKNYYDPGSGEGLDNTYAFDLIIDDWWNTDGTAGAEIVAAASGTVTTYYGGVGHGWGVYIHLSDGNIIYNDHLMNLKVVNNQWVNKGEPIGDVYDGQPGGVNHIHFQVGTNPQSLPLTFGVWDYPTPGPVAPGGPPG
ncbi:MAG: M23 family metallopeptidase, partial [Gammaproteobacteria bacterium]|nr:M23 family metallopeptidase [Gammaproteobacteria bacterium]NIW50552.1 peptidoglycan DD-metalloendopeptidase family protein [Gammaproteobacteria bacterium]